MNNTIIFSFLLVFSTFISVISQVILKKAAMCHYETRLQEYLNVSVIGAYAIFFIATVMTVYSYKYVDISSGAFLETTSYVFVFIFDVIIFREKITLKKLIAASLILGGIVITLLP